MSRIDPSEEVLTDLIDQLSRVETFDQLFEVFKTPVVFKFDERRTILWAYGTAFFQLTSAGICGSFMGDKTLRWESFAGAKLRTYTDERGKVTSEEIEMYTTYGSSISADVTHLWNSEAVIPLLQSCAAAVARADVHRVGEELRNLDIPDTPKSGMSDSLLKLLMVSLVKT